MLKRIRGLCLEYNYCIFFFVLYCFYRVMQSSIILLVSLFLFYPSFFASSHFFQHSLIFSTFSPNSISIVFRQHFVQENVWCDDESIHFCAVSMQNIVHVWILSPSFRLYYRSIWLLLTVFNKYSILYRHRRHPFYKIRQLSCIRFVPIFVKTVIPCSPKSALFFSTMNQIWYEV